MTKENTINIDFKSQGWSDLVHDVATLFGAGELIPHGWLRDRFGLAQLHYEDFDNQEEFVNALKEQQFSYMALIDKLRCELLDKMQICIRNVWGDGYTVVPANDQVRYGYDGFIKDINKATREARAIMNNVAAVDAEQQAKDNDIRAKFAMLSQMIRAAK